MATLDSIKDFNLENNSLKMSLASVIVWDSTGKLLLNQDNIICQFPVLVNESKDHTFFSHLKSSLDTVIKYSTTRCRPVASLIIHCESGIVFKKSFLSFIEDKCNEYNLWKEDEHVILSAFGLRIFPHLKASLLQNGVHFKLYSDSMTDRAVHIFTPQLCLIKMETLGELADKSLSCQVECSDHLWSSFIFGSKLGGVNWKIKTSDYADTSTLTSPPSQLSTEDENFEKFYATIYSEDWPIGINRPLYSRELLTTPTNKVSTSEIWERGFGGVNMSSEPASSLDFDVLVSYGCKVIRIGAVADAQDLNYLLNPSSTSHYEDLRHLTTVLPRLRRALIRIGEYGLKSIITITDLPGEGTFQHKPPDMKFWTLPTVRERAARFWGELAKGLADLSDRTVAGYDLINEPHSPNDGAYFGDLTSEYSSELNHFYSLAHDAIRGHDKNVMIILSPLSYASPRAIKSLSPLPDANVAYAFHMYAPPVLTLRGAEGVQHSYPGPVRLYPHCPHEFLNITFEFLHDLLKENVFKWQVENGIPSNRILVGEFGISREVNGAELYLRDLLRIFGEFGWSWLLFSFRDEEWDALDYELGTDINNMLHRSHTKLFLTVAEHFH